MHGSQTDQFITSPTDLHWGGEVLEELKPRSGVRVASYYYPARSHHFVRAFGKCTNENFQAFMKDHDLDRLNGDSWNKSLSEWLTEGDGRNEFSESDIGFFGQCGQIEVRGVYSKASGYFYLEMKSK